MIARPGVPASVASDAVRAQFERDHATQRRLADELAVSVAAHRILRERVERAIAEYARQPAAERARAVERAWREGCDAVDAALGRVGIRVAPPAHVGDEADQGPVVHRRAS